MSSMNSGASQEMNHDMWGEMMMPCDTGDDSPSMHECCESPFIDSISHIGNSYLSDPDEKDDSNDSDGKILWALHESLVSNNIQKLNSPPKRWLVFNDSLKNTYISLTGIVKNNS